MFWKKKKYEITVLHSKEYNGKDSKGNDIPQANNYLQEYQDDGWEIAGDILIKNKDGWCMNNYFHIPLKRKIK